MQNEGRIILRIEDLFCCRLFLRILRQNARTQNLICEDFEDGVGWYDPHSSDCYNFEILCQYALCYYHMLYQNNHFFQKFIHVQMLPGVYYSFESLSDGAYSSFWVSCKVLRCSILPTLCWILLENTV